MREPDLMTIRRQAIFAALDEGQFERIVSGMTRRALVRGERLFSQGDEAAHFWLVKTGAIKLFLVSREGTEKVIEVTREGELFAEAVMFMEGRRYPVNAEALADSELFAFDSRIFLDLLHESPGLALRLLGALSRRMHGLVREIDELTLHNATWRLVAWLLQESGRKGSGGDITLTVPKQVVASRLSIKPETLSRILARLRDDGLVRVDGEHITLLDPERLRALLVS